MFVCLESVARFELTGFCFARSGVAARGRVFLIGTQQALQNLKTNYSMKMRVVARLKNESDDLMKTSDSKADLKYT
jgi:hypothetical protein